MANLTLVVPTVQEIANRLMPAQVRFRDGSAALADLVMEDRRSARERRAGDPHSILVRFAAALLERNVSGASYFSRMDVFERAFGDPASLTRDHALAMLTESRYRYPATGAATLMGIARVFTAPGFSWQRYLAEAEAKWESGFQDDRLRTIGGVGNKTRDFALSEFSDCYCAPDLHVGRMMARTGLVLHGYGDPGISTADFGFIRTVIARLSRSTGWPDAPNGLSPAHIDRMFWYYGQDRKRCGATPNCEDCPANDICLTGVHRSRPSA